MLFNFCDRYISPLRLLLFLFLIIFSSCTKRNLTYFSDLSNNAEFKEQIKNHQEVKIQTDDLISILVTSLSPEANTLFNRGALPSATGTIDAAANAKERPFNESYLVDKVGNVDFPVLGKVALAGLTRNEAEDMLTKKLEKYLKEPIVFIRFLNFKVTVIGEVKNPSTFSIPTERINIIEALGLAGDMTPYGKRENVLVIREEAGIRTLARLNLNSKEVMDSPYFYLQQNDVVYVEPYKTLEARASNADRNARIAQVSLSALSLIIVIISNLGR